MSKIVEIDGVKYNPGYPLCAGCPHLTLGRGWFCFYKQETTECAYPDKTVEAASRMLIESEFTVAKAVKDLDLLIEDDEE